MTIEKCRKDLGLSCEQMAGRLGICENEYVQYENNPELMPLSIAILFCSVVRKSLDEIFFTHHSN